MNSSTSNVPTYAAWGDEIDAAAREQMDSACRLPVAVAGALMPDAHVGYGLPIGGVLATHEAVIPYAVGVDIACRVMLTVTDLAPGELKARREELRHALEHETRFGVGAAWERPCEHEVLDDDWGVTPVTARLRETAVRQLGTSGSGNHFVEFGELEVPQPLGTLAAGRYVALISHSGSRGPGSKVAAHYSELARSLHRELPPALAHLAWLPMGGPGEEYWRAMELMGRFASANHHVIHRRIAGVLGYRTLFTVENHHNYAWKERHGGREVIVHRKGATPAGAGVLGYIPGTMSAPGYIIEGRGAAASLNSSAHGAGRRMSRNAAKRAITRRDLERELERSGVELLSAGLDEAPQAYKDIERVMAAQAALVRPRAMFTPRLVKMAPPGERAED